MRITRKGFTLVELLIVIAIMGSLSVSMMMAGSKGTKKAEVAKIATAISTIGNAVQLFVSISGDTAGALDTFNIVSKEYVSVPSQDWYIVTRETDAPAGWYVSYDVKKPPFDDAAAMGMLRQISKDNGYTGTRGLRVYF